MATPKFAVLALRAGAIWLVIILLESANGTIREIFLTPVVGGASARIISFISALALISLVTYATARWLRANSAGDRIFAGLLWAALTLSFELIMARVLYGPASDRLAVDYDPRQGGLMLFGLVFLALIPTLVFTLRRSLGQAR